MTPYGGWYDGNPANLKPAPDVELVRELTEEGKLRLAGYLAEMAALAAAGDPAIHAAR